MRMIVFLDVVIHSENYALILGAVFEADANNLPNLDDVKKFELDGVSSAH
jgi:hypothetical protein